MLGLILDTREVSGGGSYSPALTSGSYVSPYTYTTETGPSYSTPTSTYAASVAPATYSVAEGTMREKPFNDPRLQSDIVYLGDTPVETTAPHVPSADESGLGKLLLLGIGLAVLSRS